MFRKRVVNLLPRKSGESDHKVNRISWITYQRYCEHESYEAYRYISHHALHDGAIVRGLPESIQVLETGAAHSLYISLVDLELRQKDCRFQLLQLMRLAIQQSIPVEYIRSGELIRGANGVSCTITEDIVSVLEHYPDLAA
jgi:hypothetical protein